MSRAPNAANIESAPEQAASNQTGDGKSRQQMADGAAVFVPNYLASIVPEQLQPDWLPNSRSTQCSRAAETSISTDVESKMDCWESVKY